MRISRSRIRITHLVAHLEPDTTVFTFAGVTLGVLDDAVDLSAVDDENYR